MGILDSPVNPFPNNEGEDFLSEVDSVLVELATEVKSTIGAGPMPQIFVSCLRNPSGDLDYNFALLNTVDQLPIAVKTICEKDGDPVFLAHISDVYVKVYDNVDEVDLDALYPGKLHHDLQEGDFSIINAMSVVRVAREKKAFMSSIPYGIDDTGHVIFEEAYQAYVDQAGGAIYEGLCTPFKK